MQLSAVLAAPCNFPISTWLFLKAGIEWDLSSEALALEFEEVSAEEMLDADAGIPTIARERQFTAVLPMADVESIVINARDQKPDASLDDLLRAFKFYMARDAFIEF